MHRRRSGSGGPAFAGPIISLRHALSIAVRFVSVMMFARRPLLPIILNLANFDPTSACAPPHCARVLRLCACVCYRIYTRELLDPRPSASLPYTLAHEHYNVTFEPCAVVRRQKPGRFSSRDARHERHLYALRSDGAAIHVTPLASAAHVEH